MPCFVSYGAPLGWLSLTPPLSAFPSQIGSAYYWGLRLPELDYHSFEVDWWSLLATIFEAFTGRLLFTQKELVGWGWEAEAHANRVHGIGADQVVEEGEEDEEGEWAEGSEGVHYQAEEEEWDGGEEGKEFEGVYDDGGFEEAGDEVDGNEQDYEGYEGEFEGGEEAHHNEQGQEPLREGEREWILTASEFYQRTVVAEAERRITERLGHWPEFVQALLPLVTLEKQTRRLEEFVVNDVRAA